jgi:hypothetical protein
VITTDASTPGYRFRGIEIHACSRTWAAIDALSLGLLILVAAVARAINLWDVPRFTDEANEAFRALLIVHGKLLPLTNVDLYIGPLWNYLLAGVFLVFGPSLTAPRTTVAVLAVLTVIPTYLLGRVIGGRWVGIIAAAFLALSPIHILVNGHIAWSNCATPLFTTLALWLTQRADARRAPAQLAWAGIPWGLALQSHPTAVLFGPALALWLIVKHPGWLRSGWLWLTVGLALIACSPLLIANIAGGFGGLRAGLIVQQQYSGGEPLTLGSYGRRLVETVNLLSDSLGGALAEFGSLRGPINAPLGLIFLVAVLSGLELTTRRGSWLPIIALAAYVLVLPVINARFEPTVPKARYIAPLLPICYVAIGVLAVNLYSAADRWFNHTLPGRWHRLGDRRSSLASLALLARCALVIGAIGLLLAPLDGLDAYYRAAFTRSRNNLPFYATVAAINAARLPGEVVYVDRGLMRSYAPGGGVVYEQYRLAASASGWKRVPVDLPETSDQQAPDIRGLLVAFTHDEPIVLADYRVQDIDEGRLPDSPAHVYRVLGRAR